MPVGCAVISCGHLIGRKQTERFYKIPSCNNTRGVYDPVRRHRRKLWIEALGRDVSKLNIEYLRICQCHFVCGKPATFFESDHPDYVPTLNMGSQSEISLYTVYTDHPYAKFWREVTDIIYLEELGNKTDNVELEFNHNLLEKYDCENSTHTKSIRKQTDDISHNDKIKIHKIVESPIIITRITNKIDHPKTYLNMTKNMIENDHNIKACNENEFAGTETCFVNSSDIALELLNQHQDLEDFRSKIAINNIIQNVNESKLAKKLKGRHTLRYVMDYS